MTALSRLAASVGSTEPLTPEAIRAIRAGAARIHDYPTLALADAALRELAATKEPA